MSSTRKTFFLPDGPHLSGYDQYGVKRSRWTGDEDDNSLFIIRLQAPHPNTDGQDLICLEVLENSTLCSVCQGIEVLGSDCHFELVHLMLSKMEDNAKTCPLCNLIASALQQPFDLNYPVLSSDGRGPLSQVPWNRKWGNLSITISNGFMCLRRLWADVTLGSYPHPQRPNDETYFSAYLAHEGQDHGICTVSIFRAQERIPVEICSPNRNRERIRKRKFDRIRAWLAEDMRKWESSTEPFIHGQYFPFRLLDVGNDEESEACVSSGHHDKGPLRLIGTRNAERCLLPNGEIWVSYAALSHRWGESTKLSSTTTDNLERRFEWLEYSQLCRTFQDAVVISREIGIRYLWIDSLCIVQDDKDDWIRESALMGDIYMNALVTFAAHSFGRNPSNSVRDNNQGNHASECEDEDAREGESHEKDGGTGFLDAAFAAEGDEPVLLGTTGPDSGHGEAFIYARRQRMFEVDIANSPLARRGWIVQERLLSPRILHFFHSQLYYESRNFGIVRAEDRTPAWRDPDQLRELVVKHNNVEGSTPLEWFKVVERFCACDLTEGKDKLLAIAGLANQFHKTSKVGYLAGLFADRAVKGFLWIARGPNLIRHRDRAPSWSWASVDGPIRYSSVLLTRPFVVVPEMEILGSIGNTLGEPKHLPGLDNVDRLIVKGFARKTSLSRDCQNNTEELFRYTPLRNELLYDLDHDGVYRNFLDDDGGIIGWASLDEDGGGECPEADYHAAIVAAEEGWVSQRDLTDVLYCTHPPTPEYEAFYATGKVMEEYERLLAADPLPEHLMNRSPDERILVKTYWVLVLKPNPPTQTGFVSFSRVGLGQIFEKTWERPGDFGIFMLT